MDSIWLNYTKRSTYLMINMQKKTIDTQKSNPLSYSKSDFLMILRKHKFIFKKGGKFGIMNYAGEIMHNAVYNEIDEDTSAGLIPARKGKLWGYIDSESSNCIEPQFNEVSSFIEEKAIVKCEAISDNAYVIDKYGTMIIPPIYDSISFFSFGLACVVIDGFQGFIDAKGEIKVPIEYPFPPFSVQSEREILINTEYGTKIVDMENNLLAFFNKIYFGNQNGSLGDGKFIVSEYYKDDNTSADGVICSDGKIIIPCRYDELSKIRDYEDDTVFLSAKLRNKYGILSPNGRLLIPFQFDEIRSHSSNCQFIVKKKDKWGIVGVDGKEKIPFIYDEIIFIGENSYYVELDGKQGIINDLNEWLPEDTSNFPFPGDYKLIDQIFDENKNKIYLCKKGRMAYIFDDEGQELLKYNCPSITSTII